MAGAEWLHAHSTGILLTHSYSFSYSCSSLPSTSSYFFQLPSALPIVLFVFFQACHFPEVVLTCSK